MVPELMEMFELKGRTAIVTGGAGFLGEEFCKTLAEAGAEVLMVDIDGDAIQRKIESFAQKGLKVLGQVTDIASETSVQKMVRGFLETHNRVDILVNNAAIDPKFDPKSKREHTGFFEDFPLAIWQEALDVNITGAMLCCREVAKSMLDQGKGVIINVSSMYGITGPDQRLYQEEGKPVQIKPVYYTVTKAGILGLTRYLATYFAGKNIRVNALTPGGVFNGHEEGFLNRYAARAVMGRMADKDELNGALLFLASDASSYMTGANLIVDGGWTAW